MNLMMRYDMNNENDEKIEVVKQRVVRDFRGIFFKNSPAKKRQNEQLACICMHGMAMLLICDPIISPIICFNLFVYFAYSNEATIRIFG